MFYILSLQLAKFPDLLILVIYIGMLSDSKATKTYKCKSLKFIPYNEFKSRKNQTRGVL